MIIGKTEKHQKVCLNEQLVQLLRTFKWRNWHSKTKYVVERMMSWFGLKGYNMKATIMDYTSAFETETRLAAELAGHGLASKSTTKRYLRASILGSLSKMASSVAIPNLIFDYHS